MESSTRHAGGGSFGEGYPRRSHMGWRWLILRTCAAILGITGWFISITGAIYVAIGAFCVRWAKRLHEAADEIRYEA